MKKLVPDLEGPLYGIPFRVIGFQAQTEKGEYTELIETDLDYTTLKNRKEYLGWKNRLGSEICKSFNTMLKIRWDRIVSFKVKYLCDLSEHYI